MVQNKECEVKKIVICFKEEKIELLQNNPDLSKLKHMILSNLDLDVKEIKIECEEIDFDKKAFLDVLVETIESIKSKLKINKAEFDKAMEELNNHNKNTNL